MNELTTGAAGDGIDEDRVAALVQEQHLVHNVVLLLVRGAHARAHTHALGGFLSACCFLLASARLTMRLTSRSLICG